MVRPPTRPLRSTLITLLVTAVALLFAFGAGFFDCQGEEFSPDRFLRRQYKFYQIPWIRLRISPVFREETTNELESYLATQELVPATKENPQSQWHVVHLTAWRTKWRGDAQFLCTLLDMRNAAGELHWLEWSRKHPDLAKLVWPHVGELARQNAYILIPELLTLAAGAETPDEFQPLAEDFLSTRRSRLAKSAAQSGSEPTSLPQVP